MPDSSLAIHTTGLRKVYGSRFGRAPFVAVENLDLSVPRGIVFGFLGPNGAGKTTTINMLLGNVYPTSGSAELLGHPTRDTAARAKLGFLPEKFQFHDFLTAEEFLDLHGKLYGMSAMKRRARIPEVLEEVGLFSRRKSRIKEFSKGMQQRVGLAQAILNEPELVILDEPTSALDPLGRRDVREIVTRLRARGMTVMLNSHLLSEIEMTCDQVAILKGGQIVRQGKIEDLLGATAQVKMRVQNISTTLIKELTKLTGPALVDGDRIEVSVKNDEMIPELAVIVVKEGGRLMEMIPMRESLDDLFVRVVEMDTPR